MPAAATNLADLYTDHHQWLQQWLRRRLGNAADAADMAHDTFVRILSKRQSGMLAQPLHEPRAYLSTIARGLVIDHWRRRELEQAWLQTLAALPEEAMPAPEVRLQALQALMEIDRLLHTLKPKVRSAFLLAQLDGLTCPQIAKHLGVSLATAERYVAQGLRACYASRFEA
ncbi:sigma-70 family RNA polymerase sigma factor [Lampropedia puyangensis]|uniref:Sigma-70 family RNA polymerase sigma factor n=1 Tax=Lampropedia puyangensis TaxID=1330072 RepID=A0A4V6T2U1_9BURK|nr:sigma-70 family RNA polymerase sigma factor [Lampropedia puyangensis]THU05076.1 sigma-70 family RNA polymerase sigma factor [Lampropedia puyangensis]